MYNLSQPTGIFKIQRTLIHIEPEQKFPTPSDIFKLQTMLYAIRGF